MDPRGDLHLLAQRADQLSRLPAHARAARREEAAEILGAILANATPSGVARARELLEARFGRQIRAAGEAALVDPWWLFRRDDGRPPVVLALVADDGPTGSTPRNATTGTPMTNAANKDIAVLAKKVYELSILPVAEIGARKWEALLVLNAVYSSATKDGIDRANADKEARWGDQIREEGILYRLHPKWHLRTDDGKPPAARFALESALDNPQRDLRTRMAALMLIPESDRGPLTDLVRALNADAWDGALTDARLKYSEVLRGIDRHWTKNPWLTVLPQGGSPPILILIDNQGVINDGSLYDKDPTDDPALASAWNHAIRNWDIDFLRDNPLAKLFTTVESAAGEAADTAADLVESANKAAKSIARILEWAPYIVAGIGTLGLTTIVLVAATRRAKYPADNLAGPAQTESSQVKGT